MGVPPIHPEIQALIDDLRQQLKAAHKEIAELRRRLDMNSSNSSKPPSSDPPWAPGSSGKKKRKRKRGAQKGHRGHHRELLPPERVDHRIYHLLRVT